MKLSYSVRCALLAAGIIIFIKLAVFFTHSQFSGIGIYSGVISLGFLVVPLSFGIKHRRDYELQGFISLKQVMATGLYISAIACVIVAAFNFIYFKFIDHEIISHWQEEVKMLGEKEHKSASDIQGAIDSLTNFYSPFNQATGSLTGALGVGVVFSFIISSFLSKRPPLESN